MKSFISTGIPLGMLAAIEVAVPGKVIETLSNPYGIATVFGLNADETKNIVPMGTGADRQPFSRGGENAVR